MSRPLTATQIWAAPLALGLLSIVGLVAALMADGIGDIVSWIALGVPAAAALWFACTPGGRNGSIG